MEYVSRHRIRFDDVDGAGIVYYPRFFHLCHQAFEDWFNECGPISYPRLITELRRGFPTVALSSQFSTPLLYGDEALISLIVERVGKSSLETSYVLLNQNGIKCFSSRITTVYIELSKQKSLPIPPDLREFFEKYLSLSQKV